MSENAQLEVSGERLVQDAPAVDEGRNAPEHSPELSVEEKVIKVIVGIPLKGHTPARSYHDRMLMWKHLGNEEASGYFQKKSPRYVFSLAAVGEILVPYARERLGEAVIAEGADYLFMVDDDMLCPPDLFSKLVAHDKDVVAALAFTRNPDHKPVIYETVNGFSNEVGMTYGFTRFVQNYPRNQLVECDAVGFGAVLIKAEVLRKIPQPWFFGMERTGEDIIFCIKAKKAGFQVFMDTSIKLGHLGSPMIVTEEYSDQWNKLSADERDKFYGKFDKYETDRLK